MPLTEYLATRRTEIDAQIKALKAELAEIRVAEEAVLALKGQSVSSLPSPRAPRTSAGVREGSIKDWVLKVLQWFPDGLETDDVIRAVEQQGGPAVSRNSMTPQLSRLKQASLLIQDERQWKLPMFGPAPPAASGEPTAVSPTGDEPDFSNTFGSDGEKWEVE